MRRTRFIFMESQVTYGECLPAGVKGPPGSVPPLLLFFQALLTSVPPGEVLSAALSLQAVRCALQHGATRLISHAVTHDRSAI